MLKDKRFLTGLGAGLMIGAMLLQLMNLAMAPGTDDPPGLAPLLDADRLEAEARRQGLVLLDADETWYSRAEVDEMLAEARSGGGAAFAGRGDEAGTAPGEAVQSGALTHFYLIDIRAGMSSDEVGEMLHAAGLVDDLDAFREQMALRGLTVKIRAGTYTFAYKPELEALIDAITLDSGGR